MQNSSFFTHGEAIQKVVQRRLPEDVGSRANRAGHYSDLGLRQPAGVEEQDEEVAEAGARGALEEEQDPHYA